MNNGNKFAAAGVAAAAAAILWLPSACAQAQAAGAGAQSVDQSGQSSAQGELQEVVVTAERRATNVQTTPISMTAVSGAQLQQQHLTTVTDLQATAPSFTVNDEGGMFESYNIRGVGNSAITPSITTGVAVFRDGLLLSETIGQNEPLFDIRDTEVLRGPQGTFVGASSTGGAVEINSQDPNFRGVNGYAEGLLGNYSDVKSDGAVNLPVNDRFATRIAYYVEDRSSFYKDIGGYATPVPSQPIVDPGKYDARDLRLGMLWHVTDNLQALAKIEYNIIDQGGQAAEPNQATYNTLFTAGAPNPGPPGFNGYSMCTGGTATDPTLVCPLPGTPTHSQYYAYSTHIPRVLNFYGTNIMFNDYQTRYGLELRYTLPDGIVIRSMSGFQHIDVNSIQPTGNSSANAGTAYQEIGPNDNYRSEEINIISPTTGRFNWIAGGYWYYRDTPVLNRIFSVNPPYLPTEVPGVQIDVPYDSVQRIGAVFGQINWQFTDSLQLQIGARDNWDNDYNYQTPAGSGGVYLLDPTTGKPAVQIEAITAGGQYKDTVPTGKIGLNWTPAAGQYFYAFYARGYKAGGVSVSPGSLPFNPEHVNDYELGWKGTLLGGHLITQVGGYYMNYQNMQYQIFDIYEAGGLTVTNLAPSTIDGIELSMQARVAHLGVNLGVAYNASKLGAVTLLNSASLPAGFNSPLPYVQCGSPLTSAGGECFNYVPYLQSVSGEQNPFSPKLTGNISVDYAIPLGNASLDPRVTYSYVDRQYTSVFQSPYTLVPSRGLLGANLDYINGPWTAELYGTNLANKVYLSGTDGADNVYYGAPRQLGVRVMRTF